MQTDLEGFVRRLGFMPVITISLALIVGCGHPTATVDDVLPAELPTTESNSWAHPIESRLAQETAGPTPITGEEEARQKQSGSTEGTFSGRITFETHPPSAWTIRVDAYREGSEGPLPMEAYPNDSLDTRDTYRSNPLPPGRYLVRFGDIHPRPLYATQWYKDVSTRSEATWVVVRAGEDTTGVDARLRVLQPPANDNIADAFKLTTFPFSDTKDTRNATLEPNEPEAGGCDGMVATVWYRFTPTAAVRVTVDTAHSDTDHDTQIAAFEGEGSPDTPVGCESMNVHFDMERGIPTASRMTFLAEPSKTYWIQVGGWEGGAGMLKVSFETTPP